MNWVILIAILLVGLLSRGDPKRGSWLGLALSIGILIWGVAAYAGGSRVTFFGAALSQPAFVIIMLGFCAYNLWQLKKAYGK